MQSTRFEKVAGIGLVIAVAFGGCGIPNDDAASSEVESQTQAITVNPGIAPPLLVNLGLCDSGGCDGVQFNVVSSPELGDCTEVVAFSFNLAPTGQPGAGQRLLVPAQTVGGAQQGRAVFIFDGSVDLDLRIRSIDSNGDVSALTCVRHLAGQPDTYFFESCE